ncbi:hypothetical protein [Psychrobacter sp. PSP]|jgi:hypothetical protein|uniref:hypothetical protein n=1 Tax=Psychrobacter sp. PSP TaxID=2734636 RepID=UPI00209594D1|nr:hypothetical protein [Psychrobacter sp. PSP]
MGQAKARGTKAQREAEAKKRKLEKLDINERPIEEIYKEFDLPDNSQFLGYVVNITESDEYVARFEDTPDVTNTAYAKVPDLAMRFNDIADALDVGKKVAEKYKTDICLLFETTEQFRVIPTFTVNLSDFAH